MQVQIKTIPGRETATKIHTWTDQNTNKPLNKGKFGSAKDIYRAMPSKKLGALNTGGLLDIIDNPYYEMSKEELGAGWEYLSEKREITRQELLEKKHGRPRGFYTNKFNRKAPKAERTYMQDLKIPLSDGTTILNTVNADDEIRYWVLQDHPFVAKSLDEYRKHLKPRAPHYIAH